MDGLNTAGVGGRSHEARKKAKKPRNRRSQKARKPKREQAAKPTRRKARSQQAGKQRTQKAEKQQIQKETTTHNILKKKTESLTVGALAIGNRFVASCAGPRAVVLRKSVKLSAAVWALQHQLQHQAKGGNSLTGNLFGFDWPP